MVAAPVTASDRGSRAQRPDHRNYYSPCPMAASLPRHARRRRRRPRRGTIRAAGQRSHLPGDLGCSSALPLLVAAFTVGRPEPLPGRTLPPSFDAPLQAQVDRDFARTTRSDVPGTLAGTRCHRLGLGPARRIQPRRRGADLRRRPPRTRPRAARPTSSLALRPPRQVRSSDDDRRRCRSGQPRHSARRERQRLGDGCAHRARAEPLDGLALAHDRLRLDRRRRVRERRSRPPRRRPGSSRRNVLAVVNLDSLAGLGPPPHRARAATRLARPAAVLLATADVSVAAQTGVDPQSRRRSTSYSISGSRSTSTISRRSWHDQCRR